MNKKKYAIYGVNRVAKDFLYIFDWLRVVCFFSEEYTESVFLGRPVYSPERIIEKKDEYDEIIVCGFNKESQIGMLDGLGLHYKRDYSYEEDFFEELDENIIKLDRPIVVWGCGKRAERLCKNIDVERIELFVDSYSINREYKGKIVKHPEEIGDWKNYNVIVAVAHNADIYSYLEEKGLVEHVDFCCSTEVENMPSTYLRDTIFDEKSYDFDCRTMLNHMEIISGNGDCICCCSTFNKTLLGSIIDKKIDEIWHSTIHKILCLSNVNRTYSFCDKSMCPFFIGKKIEKTYFDAREYEHMEKHPKTIAVGFDYSCNLKCITCRPQICIAKGEEKIKYDNFANIIKKDILPYAEFVITAGNGETFLSPAYRAIYTSNEMSNVKWLRFLSNGVLFNEDKWKELRKTYQGKVMMTISIDAASKETYEKIRSGGNFEVLSKNMEYAAKLRRNGELSYLRFNFVVQRENYKEMLSFVEWGEKLGIDEVFFTKILNWGTYTDEEFKKISMMQEDGITPKEELMEILNNPLMRSPIVDLGTIRATHEPILERNISNYYRWELERKIPELFIEE